MDDNSEKPKDKPAHNGHPSRNYKDSFDHLLITTDESPMTVNILENKAGKWSQVVLGVDDCVDCFRMRGVVVNHRTDMWGGCVNEG